MKFFTNDLKTDSQFPNNTVNFVKTLYLSVLFNTFSQCGYTVTFDLSKN